MRFKNTMTHLEKTQRETYSQVHRAEWSLWFLLSFHLLAKGQCWLFPSLKRNTHLGGSGLEVYRRSRQSRREVSTERQLSVFRLSTVHLHCLVHVGWMMKPTCHMYWEISQQQKTSWFLIITQILKGEKNQWGSQGSLHIFTCLYLLK